MRTLRDIAEYCLDYIDIAAGSSALLDGAPDRQKKRLCTDITGALQELYPKRPDAFRQRLGATIAAPQDGTATLTNGSTTANFAALNRDVRGLSVRMGVGFNQVAPAATSPGTELVMPWTGSTGSQTVRVYGDALLIPASSFLVVGAVNLEGYGQMQPVPDRPSYLAYRDQFWRGDYTGGPSAFRTPRWTGLPDVWWADHAYLGGTSSQIYLRFAPVPDRAYSVSYDLTLKPREITPADLTDDSVELPIPADFYDAILLPWVLQRWSGSAWFRNGEAREEIARQFQAAQKLLLDWSPQAQQGAEIVVATF